MNARGKSIALSYDYIYKKKNDLMMFAANEKVFNLIFFFKISYKTFEKKILLGSVYFYKLQASE